MINGLNNPTDVMADALTFHRRRHSVLAGNIANVDTPGFRPLDLEREPPSKLEMVADRTDVVHLDEGGTLAATTAFYDDDGAEPGIDGNTVNVERELAKVDANRVRYTATSRMISKRMAALRYAATDGMG